ncbi:Spike glycoprotein [Frankliniella fusca]|uniref:Spike glycoprotein n=1 Tax=Frankliniella fusca TaxID=407009 RepID=A0AAE1GSQ6_9NEOP|nr:Spike glycoprotein [Frankliniella fusca]
MLPIIGTVLNWITGVATERQLNTVISKVNQLAEGVQDLATSHENFIKATNQNFQSVRNHQTELERSMNFFITRFNKLTEEIGKFESELDIVVFKLVGTQTIMNKINILQTHLLALKTVYEKCQDRQLPKFMVTEGDLLNALKKQDTILAQHGLRPVFDLSSLSPYYKMESATCKLSNNESLEIMLDVPLTESNTQFHIMEIEPVPFLLDGITCNIMPETIRVATDGHVIREIRESYKFNSLDVYMLPRHNSQGALSKCIHKLLTNADVESISESCELHCADTLATTAHMLDVNKFSVLNPGSPLAVICGSNLEKNLPRLEQGRYELVIPCPCSVQETTGSQQTIIAALEICNINENKNVTVEINMEWASDKFEPYQLFATKRNFEYLKMHNLTIPKLSLTKVEPFKSNALSNWKNIPTYNSGWVEIALWIVIFAAVLGIGYCYLRFNFPWMALNLCNDKKREETQREVTLTGLENFRARPRGRNPDNSQKNTEIHEAINE